MKKTLSILLAVILLLGAVCAAPLSAGAVKAASYIKDGESIVLPYLTDDGQTATFSFAIPVIDLDSDYAATVNEKIAAHCATQVTRFNYAYAHDIRITPDLGWRCYLYGDVLSLTLYTNNFNMANNSAWEYKVNVKTGERVYTKDALASAGMTKDEANQILLALIRKDLNTDGTVGQQYYAAYGYAYYNKIAEELVPSLTHYYLDDDGCLRAMVYDCWKWDDAQEQVGYCLMDAMIRDNRREYVLGDSNADGKLTVMDATAIQLVLAKLPTKSFDEKAADANEDGALTVMDATAIQRNLAKLPTHEGIGELKK